MAVLNLEKDAHVRYHGSYTMFRNEIEEAICHYVGAKLSADGIIHLPLDSLKCKLSHEEGVFEMATVSWDFMEATDNG